jgi:hypothetical protein
VNDRTPAAPFERVFLLLAILLCAALAWPLRDYVTDDTFIHLQYARHLAHGEGFVFNPGEHVYGSTSPLWVMLLANAIALGVDGLFAAKLLGAAATLAALLLWFVLVRRTLGSPWLRVLSTVGWAAHAWMLRWSLSGMETPLAVALVIAGLVVFTASERWGERPAFAGVLWALAALARPECVLLLVLWAMLLVFEHGVRAGLRRGVLGLWPAAVVYGGWLAFARVYFGTFWPNTLAAKTAGGEGAAYQLEQLLRQGAIVGATDGAAVLVLAGVVLLVVVRRRGLALKPVTRLLPLAWLVMVPVLYAVRGVPVLSRYLMPLLPVLAWLAWRSLDRELGPRLERPAARPPQLRRARIGLAVGVVFAALVLTQNLLTYARLVQPQVQSLTTGMRASLIPWGRWFDLNTQPDAVVAAPDIGALGYYGRRRVVDLAGLVTPEMVPILRKMSPEAAVSGFEFARFARPDYLVDRAGRAWDLTQRSPWSAALVPLGHASLPNLGVARPGEVVYSFYRIDWAAYDSLAAAR